MVFPEQQQGCIFRDGTAFTIHRDVEKTVKSLEKINKKDAKTYKELHVKFTEGMLDIITSFMYCAPLAPEEMKARFSGPLETTQFRSRLRAGCREFCSSNL